MTAGAGYLGRVYNTAVSLADWLTELGAPLGGGIGLGLILGFVAAALARDAGFDVSFGEWTAYGGGLGGVFAITVVLLGV